MLGVKPEHKQPSPSYSLAPRAMLDRLQGDIERRMKKRPELLGEYVKVARHKLAKKRADAFTWKGELIEGLDSKAERTRTIADLEKERMERQRTRERELIDQGMAWLSRETLDAFHSANRLNAAVQHAYEVRKFGKAALIASTLCSCK